LNNVQAVPEATEKHQATTERPSERSASDLTTQIAPQIDGDVEQRSSADVAIPPEVGSAHLTSVAATSEAVSVPLAPLAQQHIASPAPPTSPGLEEVNVSGKSEITRADWVGIILGAIGTILGGASLLVDLASHRQEKESHERARRSELIEYIDAIWENLLPEGKSKATGVASFTKDPIRIAEARRNLEQAMLRDPDHSQVPPYEVLVLYAEGDYDRAAERARVLLNDSVRARATVRMYLAYALYEIGEADEAIQQLQQAIQEEADNPAFHIALGTIYHWRIMDTEAIDAYKAAIAASPGDALGYHNLGVVYAEIGMAEEAIAEFRKALRRDDTDFLTARHLGLALFHQSSLVNPDASRLTEASLAFRHALALNPADDVSAAGLSEIGRRVSGLATGPLTVEELGGLKQPL
jgi:tetratricopeptide (TPR) repeat protein